MTETDESDRATLFGPFVLTLSPEEQEFVAAHNLASQFNKFKWDAFVPVGLVPQAIACYIQQKLICYLDEQLYASSGEV